MSGFLLDTTVLIDWLRGHEPTVAWLEEAAASGQRLIISPVTVAEVFAGTPPERRTLRRRQLLAYEYEALPFDVAQAAGELRRECQQRGRPIPLPDLIQAALARKLGLAVATSNPLHFPDVATVNPREAAAPGGSKGQREEHPGRADTSAPTQ